MAAQNMLDTTRKFLGEQGLEKGSAMAFAGCRRLSFGVALRAPARPLHPAPFSPTKKPPDQRQRASKYRWWRPQGDLNPCRRRERPVSWTGLDDGDARWWWGEDSNLRRLRRQIYSLFPLATREPHHGKRHRVISSIRLKFQPLNGSSVNSPGDWRRPPGPPGWSGRAAPGAGACTGNRRCPWRGPSPRSCARCSRCRGSRGSPAG